MSKMQQNIEDHHEAELAAFDKAPEWDNPTGITPVEYKILVRLDVVEEKTVGGIIIPDGRNEINQMAQTYATLIAIGGMAFSDWKGTVPKVGDRILINKYTGQPPKAGDIENLYRLGNDKDVVAIIE